MQRDTQGVPRVENLQEALDAWGEMVVVELINVALRKKATDSIASFRRKGASEEEITKRMQAWSPTGFTKRMPSGIRAMLTELPEEQRKKLVEKYL